MAKEILSIPEENLAEVIAIIRLGIHTIVNSRDPKIIDTNNTIPFLLEWCSDEEEYLERLKIDVE